MVPASFETFFLVTAGAGGALIGLLFVAISISPRRTFDPRAIAGAQHQRLAEATLLTMFNGFLVSCVALAPGVGIGWIVLALGASGTLIAFHLVLFLARSHWRRASRHTPWPRLLRVVSLSLVGTMLYATEASLGLRLLLQPADAGTIRSLAFVIISLYALALVRAWTLLGDPQYGWSGWLNPFQGLDHVVMAGRRPKSAPPAERDAVEANRDGEAGSRNGPGGEVCRQALPGRARGLRDHRTQTGDGADRSPTVTRPRALRQETPPASPENRSPAA